MIFEMLSIFNAVYWFYNI